MYLLYFAGGSFDVSTWEGNFVEGRYHACTHLLMLAAGTGFTPMAGLIYQATSATPKANR